MAGLPDPQEPWSERARRGAEAARRRRRRRAGLVAGVALLLAAAVGYGAYQWTAGDGAAPTPVAAVGSTTAPGASTVDTLDPLPGSTAPGTTSAPTLTALPPPTTPTPRTDTAPPRRTTDRAAPVPPPARPARRPVVWIQAGHADPREPGYRDQAGAGSGPFGSEIAFTTRLAPLVIARLEGAGVDARPTTGMVEPLGAPGAAFVSLHHDSPGGAAAFGHAITGAGENYYRGEGSGDPSPVPYPDSAPHREATTVSPRVERTSRALADAIDARFAPIYTAANGAGGRYDGVQTRQGNPRMMRYYGFYRTTADARVIVEAGAAGADDAFLARTDLIAAAVADGILDHLRAEGAVE